MAIAMINFHGYKEQVNVKNISLGHCDGFITIVATNGITYKTHCSNVLIKIRESEVESEVNVK